MVSPTGPTRLALFLLCCTGAWLSVHMAPTRNPHCQKIVRELKGSSEQLLKVQEDEVGLPPSPYPLPPLTHYCQRQHVNGSALLPYFKAIQQLVPNSTVIEDVLQQLGKLSRCERSMDVPAPTVPSKRLEQKWFLSAVLRELSLCFKSL
nr:interleukin-31 [Desmodus rotundus]